MMTEDSDLKLQNIWTSDQTKYKKHTASVTHKT